MGFAVAALALALTIGAPADVTGKWSGTLTGQRPDGSTSEDTALLILTQKGSTVTGTVGGSESDQHPITTGTVDGNKLTLTAKHSTNEREYKLELTIDGDTLKGQLTSGERSAQLVAKRLKP